MVLSISTYVDPGVYIGEVIPTSAINISTVPQQLGVIGVGDRSKQIVNEAVQRGAVTGEILTFVNLTGTGALGDTLSFNGGTSQVTATIAGANFPLSVIGVPVTIRNAPTPSSNGTFVVTDRPSATSLVWTNISGVSESFANASYAFSPFAPLASRSNRAKQNTQIFANGTTLADAFVTYQPAFVQGTQAATRDFSMNNAMVLALDGNVPLTLRFVTGATLNSVTAVGPGTPTQLNIVVSTGAVTAITLAEVVLAINAALSSSAATSLGYGAGYAQVATATTGGLRLTSPLSTPLADVQVLAALTSDLNGSGSSQLFTQTLPLKASSTVMLSRLGFSATGVYTVDYVSPDLNEDQLANSDILAISKVGTFPGTSNFQQGVSYQLADTDHIFWGTNGSPESFGTYPDLTASPPPSQPYAVIATGDTVIVDLTGVGTAGVSAPISGTVTLTITGATPFTTGAGQSPANGTVVRLAGFSNANNNGTHVVTGVSSTSVMAFASTVGTAESGVTLTSGSGTYAPRDVLSIGFDGRAQVAVTLIQVAPTSNPVLGFTYGLGYTLAVGGLTAAQIAANINATFANNGTYGPRYGAVAAAVTRGGSTFVQLTTPTAGSGGSVTLADPTSGMLGVGLSGTSQLYSLTPTQLPATRVGAGSMPSPTGAMYFVTYSIARPATDYNVMKRFFTLDAARTDLGATSATNSLMLACEIAFAHGAPSIVVVQVNDATIPGSPTRNEFAAALVATNKADLITDLVPLSTDLGVQTDIKDNVEVECGPTEKLYRRAWFGLPRNTNIGDKDTAGTYVYMARLFLQVAPDSPARGRYTLVAPPQLSGVSLDIVLSDGVTVQTINLDSTFLAVAHAARKSSLLSPADSIANRGMTRFNLADLTQPWLKAERALLAGQGVMVTSFVGGVLKVLDPVTTEVGGGAAAAFSYDNTSSQKDNVTRKVDAALASQIIGIVPTDLADFVTDIRLIIRGVLTGEIGTGAIGPFRNDDGTTRPIDLNADIIVTQDPNNPTRFFFGYFYFLRYLALRALGQFSVDGAFFRNAAA